MEEQNNSKDKGRELDRVGRELQKRIKNTYGIGMDPLYAVEDAKEVGQWLLELNRYKVDTIVPDYPEAQVAEDKVQSFYEALREIEQFKNESGRGSDSPDVLKYLKQAILDEGINYIRIEAVADAHTDKIALALAGEKLEDIGFERGFGDALVRLAASMPTIEYD